MRKCGIGLLGLVVALGLATAAQAQRGEHVYLGSAHVDGDADHDRIKVGHHDGKFRAIQLEVDRGVVEFDRVVVHFGNGTKESLVFHERIGEGNGTRPIDLPGDRRVIESVELWYSKTKWEHRPKVSVFGIR
jgi:hypothetical protein